MVSSRVSTRGKVICLSVIAAITFVIAVSMLGVRSRRSRQSVRGFVVSNGQQGDVLNDGSSTNFGISQLNVVDTSTKQVILTLSDDVILDFAVLGDAGKFDIEALLNQPLDHIQFSYDGYIQFSYDGLENRSRSYTSPFSLCGGMSRSQCMDLFSQGRHTVTATPYASTGVQYGQELTVTYVVASNNVDSEGEEQISDPTGSNPVVDPVDDDPEPAVDPVDEEPEPTVDPVDEEPEPAVDPVVDKPEPAEGVQNSASIAPPRQCATPVLLDEWEWGVKKYPLTVAEAQGAKIGDDLVIVGGFIGGYSKTTRQGYALDLSDEDAEWRSLDDMPVPVGITHAAYAVAGEKLYMCGGYVGGNIGMETDVCMEYDHSATSGSQWRLMEPLPQGRAGGGMVYDSSLNALLFSAGATRPKAGVSFANDHDDSWQYNLSDPVSGWMNRTDIPFYGNHMGFVTAHDEYHRERHFFVGGQQGEEEHTGNTRENYEWIASNDTWAVRQSMPLSRGHAASATKAIACGYMVIGGTTNEHGMTEDISFYDIPSNTWTTIGSLPSAVNTAVCEFGGGYLYCETGWAEGHFSARRKLELSFD